jgi:hypothetical protein
MGLGLSIKDQLLSSDDPLRVFPLKERWVQGNPSLSIIERSLKALQTQVSVHLSVLIPLTRIVLWDFDHKHLITVSTHHICENELPRAIEHYVGTPEHQLEAHSMG